jgi:hypothetical protein
MKRASVLASGLALAVLALPPPAAADNPAGQPPFGAEPPPPLERVTDPAGSPPGFELSAARAITIADGAEEVRAERRENPMMQATAYVRGSDRWQISYHDPDGVEVAQAIVDDRSGTVIEAWRDHQVEVKLARGYEGAVAGIVSKPYVWLPLCLLFLAPFVDPRRPFRLLHLDLIVLLSFGVSHFFFNKGEIVASVPLVYPALLYLFGRMMIAGIWPRERSGALIPYAPLRWLAVGAVALAAFRIGLNLADSQVIDIGFAGVVGADRILSGEEIYEGQFTPLIDRGDSYGPFNYLAYVPFVALFPWGGGLEPLPAAHAAAIVFDLAVAGLLVAAGRRLRGGSEGRALGIALAYAWLAYPYTLYALNANGNDALVAALLVGAVIVLSSPLARGAVLGLAAAAKFGPLALAPLFAAGTGQRRWREAALFSVAFAAVWAVVLLPLLPAGGLSEFYDRTFGYQASRGSPFSIWGLAPSLEWLQSLVRAGAVVLGLALLVVPRWRSPVQIVALGAAVLIATQAGSMHWFYFFILWFAPYVLINVFATQRRIVPAAAGRATPG